MYFTINIPYRKVTFQVRVVEIVQRERKIDLDRAARRQALACRLDTEITLNRNRYFLLR